MVKKQQKTISTDLVAGLCGLFFTVSGISALHDALYQPLYSSWDWKVGVGLIIFGSMIMGVAVNRVSRSMVGARSAVTLKQKSGKR